MGGAKLEAGEKPAEKISAAVPKLELPLLKKSMGKYWKQFSQSLDSVLEEYDWTGKNEVLKYLQGKEKKIKEIAEDAIKRYGKEKSEGIYAIVASSYVSGYLHGIDPLLLVAIAEQENSFNVTGKSKTGDIGAFQVNPGKSAMADTVYGVPHEKFMKKMNMKIIEFGGYPLKEIKNIPKVAYAGSGGVKFDEKSATECLENPLYCAVWCGRTLVRKAWGIENASMKDSGHVFEMLKGYNGKESYAKSVMEKWEYYQKL